MWVLIFFKTFVWNISHSKKNWTRCDQTYILAFMQSTPYSSCRFVMKLKFSWQIFEKFSILKFHENPSIGRRVVPCGYTDRRTDMTKLIVALRNFANAPNMGLDILSRRVLRRWVCEFRYTEFGIPEIWVCADSLRMGGQRRWVCGPI